MTGGAIRSTICLTMIVRNEAHIIREALEAVAPYIDYWVIVDTGSEDSTEEVIRTTMAELGVPGELHQRPWKDFGHNRTEALQLAQGHCDYIWMMDADDTVVGTIDFTGVSADAYEMRIQAREDITWWRLQLFRDGVAWRYTRAIHEYAVCDDPVTTERLEGDYYIHGRHLGGRSLDREKTYRADRELLLAEVERDPDDADSTYYVAQVSESLEDYATARIWYARRAEMGGCDERVYYSLYRVAAMMERLGEPWGEVRDAYLRAWEFRPIRAEALTQIAAHYRRTERYELGYLYAARAAQIPLPGDTFYVDPTVYRWRALDEQMVCASWIGRTAEALSLCRRLLSLDDLPEEEVQRNRGNRDFLAAQLLASSAAYPADLARRPPARRDAEVTVSLSAGPDASGAEGTLNSFLRCCTDATRVGRFLVIDAGLAAADRAALATNYPFLDFVTVADADHLVREQIGGRYWLHLWHGWRFFAEDALLTRLIDVLESETEVVQIGINLGDARQLSAESPARAGVRRTPRGSRYLLADTPTAGPAMFDMTRLNRVLTTSGDGVFTGPAATLDEVLCIHDP